VRYLHQWLSSARTSTRRDAVIVNVIQNPAAAAADVADSRTVGRRPWRR